MQAINLLAIDLGAESGRGVVGQFDGEKITLEVTHRFPNTTHWVQHKLFWDPLRLFSDIRQALSSAAAKFPLASIGVDTWGVDFALLGKDGQLLGNPRHYRDPHTETIMEETFKQVPAADVYAQTGLQFMRFNSLFQLLAMRRDGSSTLEAAKHLLFIPDLFHYWLSGEKANEYSITSTSQCHDPKKNDWAWPLLKKLDLPTNLFGKVVPSGTSLGKLLPTLASEVGNKDIQVIAPASHDTAAAVTAVPADGAGWCYLSSGTWSLMGVELPSPIINEATRAANFTNEGGINQSVRFLKNIMGLWLVQECRKSFNKTGKTYEYDELVELAGQEKPFQALINPDDASFMIPEDMPAAITAFCKKQGQVPPTTPGSFVRCCLESLAMRYRWVVEKMEELTSQKIKVIHIVGGGSQNRLLNQFTADATGRLVIAGPTEATAIGNILSQALGLKLVTGLDQIREVVRKSFAPVLFEPKATKDWDEAYSKWLKQL